MVLLRQLPRGAVRAVSRRSPPPGTEPRLRLGAVIPRSRRVTQPGPNPIRSQFAALDGTRDPKLALATARQRPANGGRDRLRPCRAEAATPHRCMPGRGSSRSGGFSSRLIWRLATVTVLGRENLDDGPRPVRRGVQPHQPSRRPADHRCPAPEAGALRGGRRGRRLLLRRLVAQGPDLPVLQRLPGRPDRPARPPRAGDQPARRRRTAAAVSRGHPLADRRDGQLQAGRRRTVHQPRRALPAGGHRRRRPGDAVRARTGPTAAGRRSMSRSASRCDAEDGETVDAVLGRGSPKRSAAWSTTP